MEILNVVPSVILQSHQVKVFNKGEQFTLRTEVEVMRRLRDSHYNLNMHDVLEDATNLYIIVELCWGSNVLGEMPYLR